MWRVLHASSFGSGCISMHSPNKSECHLLGIISTRNNAMKNVYSLLLVYFCIIYTHINYYYYSGLPVSGIKVIMCKFTSTHTFRPEQQMADRDCSLKFCPFQRVTAQYSLVFFFFNSITHRILTNEIHIEFHQSKQMTQLLTNSNLQLACVCSYEFAIMSLCCVHT